MPSTEADEDDAAAPETPKPSAAPCRTPATKRNNATPMARAAAAKAATPDSAPARMRSKKPPEPTLLSDFLLGRPSPNRAKRRRSLEAVKAEMKAGNVGRIQNEKVTNRVAQWQKTSAAAIIPDPAAPSVDDEAPKANKGKVRAKKEKLDHQEAAASTSNDDAPSRAKQSPVKTTPATKATPKKRVVSDEHWMKNKNSGSPRRKASPGPDGATSAGLPKDFLQKGTPNQSWQEKIAGWAEGIPNGPPNKKRGPSAQQKETNAQKNEAAAQKKETTAQTDADDGIRVTPGPPKRPNRRKSPKRTEEAPSSNGGTSNQKTRKTPPPSISGDNDSYRQSGDEESKSMGKPTRSLKKKRSQRKTSNGATGPTNDVAVDTPAFSGSDLPLPVGSSAFSVSDLPLGAEAGNLRRSKPQRNSSLSAMPKVFKKVIDGVKSSHEPPPPARGINQPPSIESWLKQTSDPFIEQPVVTESSDSGLRPLDGQPNHERRKPDVANEASVDEQKRAVADRLVESENVGRRSARKGTSIESRRHTEKAKTDTECSSPEPDSPSLKRSPAKRAACSPLKSTRKFPFVEAVAEAFRGRSEHEVTTPGSLLANDPAYVEPYQARRQSRKGSEDYDNARQRTISGSDKPIPAVRYPDLSGPPLKNSSGRIKGCHRLSTIASVETFDSESASGSETDSKLSKSTVTPPSGLTRSNLRSQVGRRSSSRRMVKDSDLVSVLSLPVTADVKRTRSIVSARSIRTSRNRLDTATISDLLREVAEDEVKYMRELETLVDGVIPVLLSCVLSKSASAIAAGLFDPSTGESSNTRPIVDMGVALERLKSAHKRIPIHHHVSLVTWLEDVYSIYVSYLASWRMGFEDVVVNLEPATRTPSPLLGTLPEHPSSNQEDDMRYAGGARVDVAFLLKRPLVRIKYLTKALKGIRQLNPSATTEKLLCQFEELLGNTRRRSKEEAARLVDQRANNTDSTRARDVRTLAPLDSTSIDKTRQVSAKDYFSLDLSHSSGQRITCRVEALLRDKPSDQRDPGDLLICEIDSTGCWLLFPPLNCSQVVARQGNTQGELYLDIKGLSGSQEWRETLVLTSDDDEIASEWVELLRSASRKTEALGDDNRSSLPTPTMKPEPPAASPAKGKKAEQDQESPKSIHTRAIEVPIGERLRRQAELGSPAPSILDDTPKFQATVTSFAGSDTSSLSLDQHQEQTAQDDTPPPPPVHKRPVSSLGKGPLLEVPVLKPVTRRLSSPLKHEYQPSSDGSTTSSESEESYFSDSTGSHTSEDDSDLDVEETLGRDKEKNTSASAETQIPENLRPANEPFLAPRRSVSRQSKTDAVKLVGSISSWTESKGLWEDLHHEQCTLVIKPGIIEAYTLDASPSLEITDALINGDSGADKPLVALGLTPLVPLRQSNAVDIEVRSPTLPYSKLKCTAPIRFHSRSPVDCITLYAAVHRARMENPLWKKLEQDRTLAGYGDQPYEAATNRKRRSWFGRRNSYRGSTRAPSTTASNNPSENSSNSIASAFSALKRMSGGSFNIAKSSLDTSNGSLYTSSSGSASTGNTPPRASSFTGTGTSTSNAEPLGSSNLKIRLYLQKTSRDWADLGEARLTVTQPLPGMRQASSLYHGIERRIIVTSKYAPVSDPTNEDFQGAGVLLDTVLGGGCFSRTGAVGIAVNVWQDIVGPNGEVGMAGAVGGVSGKTRTYMFHCRSQADTRWIFALVGGGGR